MKRLPRKTITRALLYIRTLREILDKKIYRISSSELARILGISDAQVRKDISNFGKVGTPRIGYDVGELWRRLENFVLKDEEVHIVVVGIGNLGTAILKHPWASKGKIKIVAAFDKSKRKVGKTINGIRIYSIENARTIIKKFHGDIGIIAVPESYSQKVADMMVAAGLKGIVNFSPTSISVPDNIAVKDIDFSITFLSLYCKCNR